MISGWKRAAIKNMAAAFDKNAGSVVQDSEAEIDKLHSKIGQLVVERDFLKRAFGRQARSEGRCALRNDIPERGWYALEHIQFTQIQDSQIT